MGGKYTNALCVNCKILCRKRYKFMCYQCYIKTQTIIRCNYPFKTIEEAEKKVRKVTLYINKKGQGSCSLSLPLIYANRKVIVLDANQKIKK